MRSRTSQRGSTSLELVLLAPVLLAVMLLIAAFGRHAHVQGAIDQAARDAARSATATRSFESAKAAVERTIEADLATAPKSCRDSESHTVTTNKALDQDGRAYLQQEGNIFVASDAYDPQLLTLLTVHVECDVDVSDLSFVGLGQTMTIEQDFTSTVPPLYGTYQP